MDVANLDVRVNSTSVKTATTNIAGMGAASSGAMSKIKLLSGALVAMGAGKVLSKVITDTNSFTKSISELSAITGATGKDLAFYEEQAALIGKTTTLSASQAATAFKLELKLIKPLGLLMFLLLAQKWVRHQSLIHQPQ